MPIELSFLHFLETIRTAVQTTFFSFITLFGEEVVMIAVLGMIYWCIDKRLGYRIGFSYFLSGLCVQTLKITFRIPRPWILDPTLNPVSSALKTATGYSFPSGHTQSATALFGTLGLYIKQNTKKHTLKCFCCLGIIGLVAFSRMYLGVHTPKDVLVSFFVSGGLVLLAEHIFQTQQQKNTKTNTKIFLLMSFISIAIMIYAIILLFRKDILQIYASDCCKAAGAGLGFTLGWWFEERYIQFEERGFGLFGQAVKYSIGIGIAVLLKVGLKAVMGTSMAADIGRYFLLVLWITVGFPYGIQKVVDRKKIRNN